MLSTHVNLLYRWWGFWLVFFRYTVTPWVEKNHHETTADQITELQKFLLYVFEFIKTTWYSCEQKQCRCPREKFAFVYSYVPVTVKRKFISCYWSKMNNRWALAKYCFVCSCKECMNNTYAYIQDYIQVYIRVFIQAWVTVSH